MIGKASAIWFETGSVFSSVSCSTGGLVKAVQHGHGVHKSSSSWLIGHSRAGGRSRRRQAKGLPPRASLRTEVFTSVRWEMAGWLEMSYGWRTHRPFLRQCGSDNAITSRDARIGCPNARSVGTGRHHMAGSTPKRRNPRGIFHPRSVRPRPPHRRRGLAAARITFAPGFKSRVEAHNHIHGIAPCPPGIYSSCQRSHRVLFG